jgi:phage portal protein BeeE
MIQDLTRSTYSNIEVQGTEFVQHCLLPHLKRWEAAIARDLIDDDETYFAEHNVSGLLRGDHASRSAYYVSAIQNGWMSINEVREMENLNPLGVEGDKHFIQLNMTTLDKAGEEPPAPEPVAEQPVVEAEDSTADELEDDAEPEEQTDGD